MLFRNHRASMRSLVALAAMAVVPFASAQLDVVHIVSGIVKHVDKGSRQVVVKAGDGTEHTIKWTGNTTWEGTKKAGKGLKQGSQLTVQYSEKAGEETAVGIKDVGKGAEKAVK